MNLQFFKRLLLFSAVSFCFLSIGRCQDAEKKDFEIRSHHARIQIVAERQEIHCIDTLTIRRFNTQANTLELSLLRFFKINQVVVNDEESDFERKQNSLQIEDIPSDSVMTIIVSYEGRMNFRTEFSALGKDRAVFREEEILPSAKHNYKNVRFTIETPLSWDAIATGKLVHKESLADGNIFVWEFNDPIPMIGWICAGEFKKDQKLAGDVSLSSYLLPEDSAQSGRILSLTDSVLRFYSMKFSKYRFPKLAIVEVENWVAGKAVLAIAVPSMIMVKKLAFDTEDEFNKYPVILAHEIAHQWWPGSVFIEEKDAALLSEGMCEYSARLFSESSGKLTQRDSLSNHPLLRSLITRSVKGEDIPLQQKADLRATPTHYLKASFVHNMLRKIIGDTVYSSLLKDYATTYENRIASLDDFKSLAETLSNKNLTWFFDQWVKSKGIPRVKLYNVKTNEREGSWVTRGRVRIVGYDKFTTFIDVSVSSPTETLNTRVWLGTDSVGMYHNDLQFETVSATKPTTARLDPDGDILKYQKLPVKLGDLREPWDGIMVVGSQRNAEYLMQRAQHDSSEMDNAGWGFTIKVDTAITLSDLQRDRIFLYGQSDENTVVANQHMKFPYQVQADTAFVNGEQISDSSLTLIQMIENPYLANGLMCWVAPLSPKAEPELLPYDHSWTLVRGKEEITSGTWQVKEEDVVVEIK